MIGRLTCLIVSILCVCGSADAASGAMGCRIKREAEVTCDYKVPFQVKKVDLEVGGKAVEAVNRSNYPEGGGVTAIFVLIDTSDPNRSNVVKENIAVADKLISATQNHHRLGIASFDADLHPAAPLGTPPAELHMALKKVVSGGMATELYRSALGAIAQLKAFQASRKILLMMSDGQAEDTAYNHEDVIAAAKDAGVEFAAFGYAFSASKAAALQRMRRLAEETGGYFIEADEKQQLPKDAISRFLSHSDRGGQFSVSLAGLYGQQELKARFEGDSGVVAESHSTITMPAAPERVTPPEDDKTLVFSAGGVGVLALLGVGIFFLRRRSAPPAPRIFGWLEAFDGSQTRYPVMGTALRIGRGADNDIHIRNDSISVSHAVIQRRRDGAVIITDLGSTNGTLLNEQVIKEAALADGDVIELGEVRLRYVANHDGAPQSSPGGDKSRDRPAVGAVSG